MPRSRRHSNAEGGIHEHVEGGLKKALGGENT